MSVELSLSRVEADCKCFPAHRGYNGDSLTSYLRKPDWAWTTMAVLIMIPCRCITPRHRHGERRLRIGGEFVGTVRTGLSEANRSQRSTSQPDQELT